MKFMIIIKNNILGENSFNRKGVSQSLCKLLNNGILGFNRIILQEKFFIFYTVLILFTLFNRSIWISLLSNIFDNCRIYLLKLFFISGGIFGELIYYVDKNKKQKKMV